jgi:hypothetical protein
MGKALVVSRPSGKASRKKVSVARRVAWLSVCMTLAPCVASFSVRIGAEDCGKNLSKFWQTDDKLWQKNGNDADPRGKAEPLGSRQKHAGTTRGRRETSVLDGFDKYDE